MDGGREFTRDQELAYQSYVARKDRAGREVRSPEDWRQRVHMFAERKARGDQFRDRVAEELQRTEERDWQKEVHVNTPLGGRRYDIANRFEQVGYEIKSGWVIREHALRQLAKDEHMILDEGWQVQWVVRDLSTIDREVRAELERLQEHYPGRFEFRQMNLDVREPAVDDGKGLHYERERAQVRERAPPTVESLFEERLTAHRQRLPELDRLHERMTDARPDSGRELYDATVEHRRTVAIEQLTNLGWERDAIDERLARESAARLRDASTSPPAARTRSSIERGYGMGR